MVRILSRCIHLSDHHTVHYYFFNWSMVDLQCYLGCRCIARWFSCTYTSLLYIVVCICWASLVAQLVKNLPAMQETPVWFLGWEDPLEKGWLPTPVFCLEEFHGQGIHGVANSQTQLSNFPFQCLYANPKLLVCATPPFPFGNPKLIFCICGSIS